ncbi:HAD hydrolase-like protein, partial [Rosenbergiella collisarenosi]
YMVGDKKEDMLAALAAGVGHKVLVRTGKDVTPESESAADLVMNSLADLPKYLATKQ